MRQLLVITSATFISKSHISHLLVRVVHVVVDGIAASNVRATISRRLAPVGSARLGRGIVDIVAVSIAVVAFKRVNQVAPVADLVDGDAAGAVDGATAGRNAAGGGPGAHDAAVVDEVRRAIRRGDGVCAEAGVALANVADVVEVEGAVVALAECLLHTVAVAVVGPVLVDGPVGVFEGELEAGALEVLVEDGDLLGDGCLLRGVSTFFTAQSRRTK